MLKKHEFLIYTHILILLYAILPEQFPYAVSVRFLLLGLALGCLGMWTWDMRE